MAEPTLQEVLQAVQQAVQAANEAAQTASQIAQSINQQASKVSSTLTSERVEDIGGGERLEKDQMAESGTQFANVKMIVDEVFKQVSTISSQAQSLFGVTYLNSLQSLNNIQAEVLRGIRNATTSDKVGDNKLWTAEVTEEPAAK